MDEFMLLSLKSKKGNYASFCDGAVGVFDAESLRLHCRIAPSAYYSFTIGNEQVNELLHSVMVDTAFQICLLTKHIMI